MGTLYFTRHGETIWNVENKICGVTDIALTERGHEQAIALGKQLAAEKLPIDEILYSPLVRASETARHISEETGILPPNVCEGAFPKPTGTMHSNGCSVNIIADRKVIHFRQACQRCPCAVHIILII